MVEWGSIKYVSVLMGSDGASDGLVGTPEQTTRRNAIGSKRAQRDVDDNTSCRLTPEATLFKSEILIKLQ